jgi:transposase
MFAQNRMRVVPWPAKVADLNPIENLWDLLKRKVKASRKPFNLTDLTILANQVWSQIPQRYIQRYTISM